MGTGEQIVWFIREFKRERRYAPSLREIADGIGLASTCSVAVHLRRLRRTGVLTFVDREPRTIVLAEEREAA